VSCGNGHLQGFHGVEGSFPVVLWEGVCEGKPTNGGHYRDEEGYEEDGSGFHGVFILGVLEEQQAWAAFVGESTPVFIACGGPFLSCFFWFLVLFGVDDLDVIFVGEHDVEVVAWE